MKKIKVNVNDNTLFMKAVKPAKVDNEVRMSVAAVRNLTGMSSQKIHRIAAYNGLVLKSSKYNRKQVSAKTQERINYIRKRVKENPKITLEQLGKEMDCSKQSVSQLIHRYRVLDLV